MAEFTITLPITFKVEADSEETAQSQLAIALHGMEYPGTIAHIGDFLDTADAIPERLHVELEEVWTDELKRWRIVNPPANSNFKIMLTQVASYDDGPQYLEPWQAKAENAGFVVEHWDTVEQCQWSLRMKLINAMYQHIVEYVTGGGNERTQKAEKTSKTKKKGKRKGKTSGDKAK